MTNPIIHPKFQGNVPAESYMLFMDTLLDTVRGEIAACIERAYLCISCGEAARRLNLPSQQAVREYGQKVTCCCCSGGVEVIKEIYI